MKSKPLIAVDCDLTLVDSDKHWIDWLEKVTGTKLEYKDRLDYDLTKYFKAELAYEGLTGYEFWNSPTLYDHMEPMQGSIEALQHIKSLGVDLVCLSRVMGHHGASKRAFIERYFPFFDATYLCGKNQKSFLHCDIIIEDRCEELKGFTKDTTGIILYNRYIELCPIDCLLYVARDWSDVAKWCQLLLDKTEEKVYGCI